MLKIRFLGNYYKSLNQLLEEQPELSLEIDKRVKWFVNNPEDTRLDNHALRDDLEGKYAFDITGDIRIVYEWLGKTTVRFLAIGGHVEVYYKNDP